MIASRTLLGAPALTAIAVLVVNDHVLKASVPGVITGKLSDIAGMIFFPLLLAAMLEQVGVRRGVRTVVVAAIATGLAFAAIKLWGPAGDCYRSALGALQWPFRAIGALVTGDPVPALGRARLTVDPTDLVALPGVLVAIWLVRERVAGALPACAPVGGHR